MGLEPVSDDDAGEWLSITTVSAALFDSPSAMGTRLRRRFFLLALAVGLSTTKSDEDCAPSVKSESVIKRRSFSVSETVGKAAVTCCFSSVGLHLQYLHGMVGERSAVCVGFGDEDLVVVFVMTAGLSRSEVDEDLVECRLRQRIVLHIDARSHLSSQRRVRNSNHCVLFFNYLL